MTDYNTQDTEPSPRESDSWTVVLIPDTQHYVSDDVNTKVLDKMMKWIAEEKENRNIKMVVHLGDMTDQNRQDEWERIRHAYTYLDNEVPYLLCVGNHDQASYENESSINEFFTIGDNECNQKVFGGSFESDKLQNAYYIFNQSEKSYLFMALEYAPRDEVIAWADGVIKDHPDHRVLMSIHQYMTETSRLVSEDGRPDPLSTRGEGNDKVGIFKRLAQPNPNVEFIVCGHVYAARKGVEGRSPAGYEGVLVVNPDIATGHRSDEREGGQTIHQILFNAQWIKDEEGVSRGGDGWMLLMEFSGDNREVKVKSHSPYRNHWRTGAEFEYILKRS